MRLGLIFVVVVVVGQHANSALFVANIGTGSLVVVVDVVVVAVAGVLVVVAASSQV